jgi:hypothetical protein
MTTEEIAIWTQKWIKNQRYATCHTPADLTTNAGLPGVWPGSSAGVAQTHSVESGRA